jgi:hypothetical protein
MSLSVNGCSLKFPLPKSLALRPAPFNNALNLSNTKGVPGLAGLYPCLRVLQ